jgi:hypothetical protein
MDLLGKEKERGVKEGGGKDLKNERRKQRNEKKIFTSVTLWQKLICYFFIFQANSKIDFILIL